MWLNLTFAESKQIVNCCCQIAILISSASNKVWNESKQSCYHEMFTTMMNYLAFNIVDLISWGQCIWKYPVSGAHTNPCTWRIEKKHSGKQFQKDVVSVSGFTSFMWTENDNLHKIISTFLPPPNPPPLPPVKQLIPSESKE